MILQRFLLRIQASLVQIYLWITTNHSESLISFLHFSSKFLLSYCHFVENRFRQSYPTLLLYNWHKDPTLYYCLLATLVTPQIWLQCYRVYRQRSLPTSLCLTLAFRLNSSWPIVIHLGLILIDHDMIHFRLFLIIWQSSKVAMRVQNIHSVRHSDQKSVSFFS